MQKIEVTKLLSKVNHLHTTTDVLTYGKKRRDFHMLGSRITVRRMGRSGVTTGPLQAQFYVCDETKKIVVCGPLSRLRHADLIIDHMMLNLDLKI